MKKYFAPKLGRTLGMAAVAISMSLAPASAADYPEMKLKVAHALSEAFLWADVDKWFFSELEERSGGNITSQVFWNGSLVGPKQVLDAVGKGGIPMGADAQGYYPTALPLNTMPNALLGTLTFSSPEHSSIITREIFENFPEMQEEFKALGVWPLYFHAVPSFRVACTKPIATVDDFRDKKMRQFSAYHPKVWSSVGAVGVTVLPAEIYEGLQRGRLDCVFYDYSSILGQKMYEVAPYVSTANFGAGSTWPLVVNYDLYFNEWSDDLRNLVTEIANETSARSVAVAEARAKESLDELAAIDGVTIVEFSPEEQAKMVELMPDFIDLWVAQQEGTDRHDVAKRIGEYVKTRAKELAGG